jgi:hypothetical protein
VLERFAVGVGDDQESSFDLLVHCGGSVIAADRCV